MMQTLAMRLGAATIFGLGAIYGATWGWNNHSRFTQHEHTQDHNLMRISDAVSESKKLIKNIKDNCPGIAVAVSLNGKMVWQQGFGYANLENKIPCTPHTVMKTASISKSITSVLMAKLWEMGLLDMDQNVQTYVKYWPKKCWKGDEVTLTTRHLASHRAGVRDYKRIKKIKGDSFGSSESYQDFEYEEYYIKDKYDTVMDSVSIFKDDPLIAKPGCEFHYTTHGYTLLSACLEGATGQNFPTLIRNMYVDMGLTETYLDDDKQNIIYNRSSHHVKKLQEEIENSPFTESSFKLAGAGMLSCGADLIKFANTILYSYQCNNSTSGLKSGYLKSETVRTLWKPIKGTSVSWDPNGAYGMGWQIVPYNDELKCGITMSHSRESEMHPMRITNTDLGDTRFLVGHTGGTVGASCALMILPSVILDAQAVLPQGVVVVILANMQGLSLGSVAAKITKLFDKCL